MDAPVQWFISQGSASLLALLLGVMLGRRRGPHAWLWLTVGWILLITWVWLSHHPTVAVQALSPGVLRYIEGTGAVPAFMLIVGIAFGRARLPRQRRVAGLAIGVGLIFFLQGGMWMIQTTPQIGFAGMSRGKVVQQSTEFSCVPAACATALNQLGIRATEAEMASLTDTRPGTGATLIRALDGLNRRLRRSPYVAQLLEPTFQQLAVLPMPALTPVKVQESVRYTHMVVLLAVSDTAIRLADPVNGYLQLTPDAFQSIYTGQVIAFQKR